MKKFLVLLTVTALALGAFAACNDKEKETTPVETTTFAPLTQASENVTEEATEAREVRTTVKTKEPEKTVKENKAEVPLPNPTEAVNNKVKVSKEEAKKTVLAHAGFNEADVKFLKVELDKERNGLVYEIEFDSGKYEYDYEVDAENGKVLKAEKELKD